MPAELPVHSIAAIATLTASIIAATISFVNLTLTKEQKTSEFRQKWIDSLREELSMFFGCARTFARATEEKHKLGDAYENESLFKISEEKISDIRYQVTEVFSRIKLRLNSDEPEHKELLRLLKRAIDEQNIALKEKTDSSKTLKAIEVANDYAAPVLKAEWKRVKKGELPFRIARNWVAPIVFISSVVLITFIWTGTFK
jgi:hypothetical protein